MVEDDDGSIGDAQLRAGDGIIMVSAQKDDDLGMAVPGPDGRSTMGVYLVADDADAHHNRGKAAGREDHHAAH